VLEGEEKSVEEVKRDLGGRVVVTKCTTSGWSFMEKGGGVGGFFMEGVGGVIHFVRGGGGPPSLGYSNDI